MAEHWTEHCWKSREWRLNHLYWIEQKSGIPTRFRMNWAQEELFRNLWTRNNILKARQLGISTLTSLMILDACLFQQNFHAGIIDRTMADAKEKLQKIRFALRCMEDPPTHGTDYIPDQADRDAIARFSREWLHTISINPREEKCSFGTGSWVRVATSMRGGTLQFLHVSEFGSIAANNPKKAREIRDGALQSVSQDCIVVMESTHEGGKRGLNYDMTRDAMEHVGRRLTQLDYRFFFFPWWRQPEYRIDSPDPPEMTQQQRDYFKSLTDNNQIQLSDAQKRWYIRQEAILGGSVMQEFPSTPAEAFETRIDGAIYGRIISEIRANGQLARDFDADDSMPLYISWDLGMADYTTLWLIQPGSDGKFYILDCHAAHGQALAHYVAVARKWEAAHGQSIKSMLLPHDAAQRDLVSGLDFTTHLRRQGFTCIQIPRVRDIWVGIQAVRRLLRHCIFHRRCAEPHNLDGEEIMSGLNALENYRTAPEGALGVLRETPLHDECSHYADAFRTFAEAFEAGRISRDGTARAIIPNRPATQLTARGVPW